MHSWRNAGLVHHSDRESQYRANERVHFALIHRLPKVIAHDEKAGSETF